MNEVGSTSNAFIRATAGDRVTLTDAPCGAGAAAFAFLAVLAELRASSILPRLPLYVALVGAEISAPARVYAKAIVDKMKVGLASQAIFVTETLVEWDVTDSFSNTDLIKCCDRLSSDSSSRLLVVANFNGFLERGGKTKAAMPQLNELFRYASGDRSFAIWIEPNMNRATNEGGLFPKIVRLVETLLGKIQNPSGFSSREKPSYTSEALFRTALERLHFATVRLAVMPIDLTRPR